MPDDAFQSFETQLLQVRALEQISKSRDSKRRSDKSVSQAYDLLLSKLLADALVKECKKLHFECFQNDARIRVRIDNQLEVLITWSVPEHESLIQAIRRRFRMDQYEARRPQVGRERPIRARAKWESDTIQSNHGRVAVIRRIQAESRPDLESLQLSTKQFGAVSDFVDQTRGMIWVSGRTFDYNHFVTAYLSHQNELGKRVIALQCRPEIPIDGVTQIDVCDSETEQDSILRTIGQNAPDVLFVELVKNENSYQSLIKMAACECQVILIGECIWHMHWYNRLIGLSPQSLSAVISGFVDCVSSPRVCHNCRESYRPHEKELQETCYPEPGSDNVLFSYGRGCDSCDFTGLLGREPFSEISRLASGDVDALLRNELESKRIRKHLVADGMETIRQDALRKLKLGLVRSHHVKHFFESNLYD